MPSVWELIVSDETHRRLWFSPLGLQEQTGTDLAVSTDGGFIVLVRPDVVA